MSVEFDIDDFIEIYGVQLFETTLLKGHIDTFGEHDLDRGNSYQMGHFVESLILEQFVYNNPRREHPRRFGVELNKEEYSIEFIPVDSDHKRLIDNGDFYSASLSQDRFDVKICEHKRACDIIRNGDVKFVKKDLYNNFEFDKKKLSYFSEILTLNQLKYIRSMDRSDCVYLLLVKGAWSNAVVFNYSMKVIKIYKHIDYPRASIVTKELQGLGYEDITITDKKRKTQGPGIGQPRKLGGTGKFAASQDAVGTGQGNDLSVIPLVPNQKPAPRSKPSFSGRFPKKPGKPPIQGGTEDAGPSKPLQ